MAMATEQMRVEEADSARALLHPLRSRVLAELREPRSATEVAKALGQPAPRINHHVRRLKEAGLIRRAGTRRVRNLTEVLYVAMARTFVISEALTPGGERRGELRRQSARRPLRNLVAVGERLAGDALRLLDEAAWDEREFSTYASSLDLSFPDAESRAAFLGDLLSAIEQLKGKYGAQEGSEGERYQAMVACYPARR